MMKSTRLLIQVLLSLMLVAAILVPAGQALGQSSPAQVGVFDPVVLPPDAQVEVPIRIKNVTDLYAMDIELRFDPAILQAQDADPNQPGIQMGFGGFLDPGLLLYNTVDNTRGIARFVLSQVNPSEPKSGSGLLLVLYFRGVKAGVSNLSISNLQLASRQGTEIPSEKVENTVTVDEAAALPEATAIPVVNPTAMILIPTEVPSPTPTITPVPSATAVPTLAPTLPAAAPTTAAVQPTAGAKNIETSPAGFSLLRHWWIVALVVAVAIGLGFILVRTRPKTKE